MWLLMSSTTSLLTRRGSMAEQVLGGVYLGVAASRSLYPLAGLSLSRSLSRSRSLGRGGGSSLRSLSLSRGGAASLSMPLSAALPMAQPVTTFNTVQQRNVTLCTMFWGATTVCIQSSSRVRDCRLRVNKCEHRLAECRAPG